MYISGGNGYDSIGTRSILNDIWKFKGIDWIWLGGDTIVNNVGNYGAKGTPSIANEIIASRDSSISIDQITNKIRFFAGDNKDDGSGLLNNLWSWSK